VAKFFRKIDVSRFCILKKTGAAMRNDNVAFGSQSKRTRVKAFRGARASCPLCPACCRTASALRSWTHGGIKIRWLHASISGQDARAPYAPRLKRNRYSSNRTIAPMTDAIQLGLSVLAKPAQPNE